MAEGASFLFGGIHFNRRKFATDFSRFEVRIFQSMQLYYIWLSIHRLKNLIQAKKKETNDSNMVEEQEKEEEPVRVSVKKRKRKTDVSGKQWTLELDLYAFGVLRNFVSNFFFLVWIKSLGMESVFLRSQNQRRQLRRRKRSLLMNALSRERNLINNLRWLLVSTLMLCLCIWVAHCA